MERRTNASYTPLKPPRIVHDGRSLSETLLAAETHAILLLGRGQPLRDLPFGEVFHERLRRHRYGETSSEPLWFDLPNDSGTRVALAYIDAKASPFALLTLARKLVAPHALAARLCLVASGLEARLAAAATEAVVAAALAQRAPMPDFRRPAQSPAPALAQIRIVGAQIAPALPRLIAEARGNHLARYFTALPADVLTPDAYRRAVVRIAREQGWQSEFFDLKKLRARKAGAFLAVTRGSTGQDAGILKLSYRPTRKSRGRVALVGKGICFDTGGMNLKAARHMYGMHEDMEGSAVALGTLLALSELKVPMAVDVWLALARNDIGPNAYHQNQVVTALNGTTIEVVHTDAEGRMVLADTLSLACASRPELVIDYATLTGSCVYALGSRYSGAATNRPHLFATLVEAGRASGERVWPFPIDDDYEDELKSDIADIKQCTLEGEADHILAALFLRRFLAGDPTWVHLDLSAGRHKGGLAHIPTDVTGFGVRFGLNLLLDQDLLGRPAP